PRTATHDTPRHRDKATTPSAKSVSTALCQRSGLYTTRDQSEKHTHLSSDAHGLPRRVHLVSSLALRLRAGRRSAYCQLDRGSSDTRHAHETTSTASKHDLRRSETATQFVATASALTRSGHRRPEDLPNLEHLWSRAGANGGHP